VPLDTTPHAITALLALGMALAFFIADRHSPSSRALALFLAFVGLSIGVGVLVAYPLHLARGVPAWDGVFAIPDALAFWFGFQWILCVRRTIPARSLNTRGPDRMLRVAQALSAAYLLLAFALPQVRHEQFMGAGIAGAWQRPGFYLFALPLGVALLLGLASGLIMLNRRPDRAETQRMVAFVIAAPFMASGLVLPAAMAPLGTAIGLLIFLVGGVQYHVTQGQRAHFMSRFLAPQVAELVRRQGLKSATQDQTLELSVVCCDLRGFTAFSGAATSHRVIEILREYYDEVGAAAAESGGTIKDLAGDGVLILVGAPIATPDHAARAVELAKRIRGRGLELAARWSDAELRLGVGVGVASGVVTVGVVGGAARLEYTAVGPAVNLASRLCAEAAHGEILIAERTAGLLGQAEQRRELRPGEALRLKGFEQPVQSYTLAPA
jgi:class 3 adenylate cyclase